MGQPLVAERSSAWWLDQLGNECSALRLFGPAGDPVYVTFARSGRDQPVSVTLSGKTMPVIGAGQSVTVYFSNGVSERLMSGRPVGNAGSNRVVALEGLSMDGLARAESGAVNMQLGFPTGTIAVRLEDMRNVVAHLRNCAGRGAATADSSAPPPSRGAQPSRNGGRNSATRPAGGSRAATGPRALQVRGNESEWIRGEDLSDVRINGALTVTLAVDARGRVAGCAITESSGNSDIDTRMCRLLTTRARFDPALDASGTAVTSSYRKRIRFAAGPEN